MVDCARVGWTGLRGLVTEAEVRRRQGYACIVKVIVIWENRGMADHKSRQWSGVEWEVVR